MFVHVLHKYKFIDVKNIDLQIKKTLQTWFFSL